MLEHGQQGRRAQRKNKFEVEDEDENEQERPGDWKPGSRTRASDCFEDDICAKKHGCQTPGHWKPGSRTRAEYCFEYDVCAPAPRPLGGC